MNKKRALAMLQTNELENFFFKHSISKTSADKYGYVNFPVDLGVVGYRVFFVSPNALTAFKQVTRLSQLKKFSIGQGVGWLDTKILRHNGFKVIEGTSYEGIFKMVARNRVDLFARGINELLYEYQARATELPLIANTSTILYYPLPRFFLTNKGNHQAIERIELGLDIAYKDGSLFELWKEYYLQSVRFIDFKAAKIFEIPNPFLEGLDDSYKQYIFKPEQLITR